MNAENLHKALGVPHLSAGVDDLFVELEALVAAHAEQVLETRAEVAVDDSWVHLYSH